MIAETARATPSADWARGAAWPFLRGWWARLLRGRPPRQLRLAESLSLGDRRFVAVIEFAQARYLVGGTSASLVLLARLDDGNSLAPASERAAPLSPAPGDRQTEEQG